MKANPYMNLNRIEYIVTLQCSGKCRHCSVGPALNRKGSRCIPPQKAVEALQELAARFSIESVMTFGGEPLLHIDATCAIHSAATNGGVSKRQLITNGYFSKDLQVIRDTAVRIHQAGINQVLLSVDAFHQETIPLETVRLFIAELLACDVPNVKLHPAWVVDALQDNSYNRETRRILEALSSLGADVSHGNNIFPSGNAAVCLREFYPLPKQIDLSVKCGEAPYTGHLDDVQTLSIEPSGDVMVCGFVIGNIVTEDVNDIVDRYDPYADGRMNALLEGGVDGLLRYAGQRGVAVDMSDCHTACAVCRKAVSLL